MVTPADNNLTADLDELSACVDAFKGLIDRLPSGGAKAVANYALADLTAHTARAFVEANLTHATGVR